jgi:hypothetical protein
VQEYCVAEARERARAERESQAELASQA